MTFLNDTLQSVVLMVCDKHAPALLEKLHSCPDGNWFVMPSIANCRTGYWPHLSPAHAAHGQGCAVFGFVERMALAQRLREFASLNSDGSLCPDCVAYEWNVSSTPIGDAARDPVCGRMVAASNSQSRQYEGELFFFCSVGCRDTFIQSPQNYLSAPQQTSRVEAPHISSPAL